MVYSSLRKRFLPRTYVPNKSEQKQFYIVKNKIHHILRILLYHPKRDTTYTTLQQKDKKGQKVSKIKY